MAKKKNQRYLEERRQYVSDTIRMRLTITEALAYMQDKGYPIAQATLERDKKLLNDNKLRKLYHIAKTGFADQHTERLELLEMAERELFANYRAERSPFKRSIILEKIIQLQPYISGYYESCRDIMEESEEIKDMIKHLPDHEDKVIKNKDEKRSTQEENNILPSPERTQDEQGLNEAERQYRKEKDGAVFDY